MKKSINLTGYAMLAICGVAMLLIGCGEEATYKGKTANEWIKTAEDKDWETSSEAEKALLRLSHDSERARDYMTKAGADDADFLLKLATEIGDGKGLGGGEESVWLEFMDTCGAYIRLSENWLVDSTVMVKIGEILESWVDTPEIGKFDREFFVDNVKPIIDRHREFLSKY